MGPAVQRLSIVIRGTVDGVTALLRALPSPFLIALMGVLAWVLRRSWGLSVFVVLALLFILNQGYWDATLETLSLVVVATLLLRSLACRSASPPRIVRGSTRGCGPCSI